MTASGQRGFTLVEVLIALGITAFVSMIAYTSISTVITSVATLRDNGDRAIEINRAWAILSRDLREFAPRPVRDEFGDTEPALAGGRANRFLLSLSRAGWHNPHGHPRSNLQRINYRLEDDELLRDSYFVLDRAGDTEAQTVVLLEGVEDMQLAFLGSLEQIRFESRSTNVDTANWAEDWVTDTSNPEAVPQPPQAVEIRLQLQDWGEMRRIYALPPL
ncbi:MAG: type II secretion system minor pseudopilin GspJ [Halioglobus sp.]|nr:type II secretion system minor pseudopilin GspJ [Halioglobus sp.]